MPGQLIDLAAYREARRSVREGTVDMATPLWLWPAWEIWTATIVQTLRWWAVPIAYWSSEWPCHGAAPLLVRGSSDHKLPHRSCRPIDHPKGSTGNLTAPFVVAVAAREHRLDGQ